MGATDADPFAIFHTPPPNETPGERAAREAKEAEQKRVSDLIDEQLKAEKLEMKKQKHLVRVLLLGQSESGELSLLFGLYIPDGIFVNLQESRLR